MNSSANIGPTAHLRGTAVPVAVAMRPGVVARQWRTEVRTMRDSAPRWSNA
jgi:hypothetical protein